MARDKGPTDAEFSALLDQKMPDRLQDPDNHEPANIPSFSVQGELERNREVEATIAEATPVAPEDGLVPEPEPVAVTPPVDPKYAGKTTDELIEMHRNVEQLVGRQGQQLGELQTLRSELDQMKGALAAREPQQAPLTQETVDWVEESVIGNPRETLEWVEKNQPALKERALATWGAIDPRAAAAYETQKAIEANDAKWEARFASVEAPFRASETDKQLERAYVAVSASLPGFTDVSGDLPALLDANPDYKQLLVNGDLATKQRVLDNLGKVALANRALAQQNIAEVPAPVVTEPPAVDPRITAAVASGSSSGEHGGETPTSTDKLKSFLLSEEPTNLHAELARNRAKAR